MLKLVDVVLPMEEGHDAKQRAVTSKLHVVDVVKPMEECGDVR